MSRGSTRFIERLLEIYLDTCFRLLLVDFKATSKLYIPFSGSYLMLKELTSVTSALSSLNSKATIGSSGAHE